MTRPAIPEVVLGRTGLRTTRVGLGSVVTFATGPDEEWLLAVLRRAFALGIKHVDTAPLYGSEELLGRLIPHADPPADLLIVTKCGHWPGQPVNYTAGDVRAQAENSLRVLCLEKLPVILIHDCLPEHLPQIMGPGGALSELRRLQAEGLVGFIGMATRAIRALQFAIESDEFDVIQFPRLHTLLNQAARVELLGPARARNLATINVSPFAGNILATGAVEGARYAYAPATTPIIDAVRRMETRCAELGVRLPVAALAYSLAEPQIDVTVLGAVTPEQLDENLQALDAPITRAQLESVVAAGRVDPAWLGAPDFLTVPPNAGAVGG